MAILDAQLEQGTAVFDDMILDEQEKQRSSARDNASTAQDAARNTPAQHEPYENAVARKDGGLYGSSGGGSGGGGGAGSAPMPSNTAKYPAPGDIPSGADDDVVARQLREAAQREPDPAVREKLWDEYRKYKGIGQ